MSRTEKSQDIIELLHKMRRWKNNQSLLIEYFLEYFSAHPQEIRDIIQEVKSELLKQGEGEQRKRMAQLYLFIFSYLCDRFGLYQEKLELDDLSFSLTEPQEYQRLKKELRKYQKKSEKIIKETFAVFEELLSEAGIQAEVKWRYKNLLSISKKCKKNKIRDALKLKDIFAFRIVIDGSPEKCFDVLNMLHDAFIPLPQRYKDYVTIPKINGYQSLHTGLLWVNQYVDMPIEVQIRTKVMDNIAESGIAAHFVYAQSKTSRMLTEKEKKLIQNMQKVVAAQEKESSIYCLTPMGDIVKLEYGSTAKDFAKKIHSKLEKKAKWAIINETRKTLKHKLKNLDKVEIITQ